MTTIVIVAVPLAGWFAIAHAEHLADVNEMISSLAQSGVDFPDTMIRVCFDPH